MGGTTMEECEATMETTKECEATERVEMPMDPSWLSIGGVLDMYKEDPIGRTIRPASLRPPRLPGGDPSRYMLLDLNAYIAERRNATTATSFTRAGHEIRATLCSAQPPLVSYLCVSCPALTPSHFGTEPRVLATDDDLILFQSAISIPYACHEQALQDYFVYGTSEEEGTFLTRLPHPGTACRFGVSTFGILDCNDPQKAGHILRRHGPPEPHYVVAVLCNNCCCQVGKPNEFHLHRFRSGASKWDTTLLQFTPAQPSRGLEFFSHITRKVINLGGGFMGWVDLSEGILVCDVVAPKPQMFFIHLPQLLNPGRELPGDPTDVRDVAVVNGCIQYVEHHTQVKKLVHSSYVSENWKAATCRMRINLQSWNGRWEDRLDIDGEHMLGSVSDFLKTASAWPHLRRLHTGLPTISLDDGDVIYFLAKVDHRDQKAALLRVNMREGALEGAAWYGTERMVGISSRYTQMATAGGESRLKKRHGRLLGSSTKKKLLH